MPSLKEAQVTCDLALQALEPLFKPQCRLTLLMRNPESPDNAGNMLLTRDDLGEVESAIRWFRDQETASCPRWSTEEDCDCRYCRARELLDLSERLRRIPVMYGTDDGDIGLLRALAADLSQQAVQDDLAEES